MQLYFKEFGSGEPLIILHGLFGSSDNWMSIAPKLASQSHIFTLDLRNHGQSPHSDEMTYALMARDVVEFLDSQKLESAMVLGHSMGGKVAMRLALDFPERVRRLIVADMATRAYEPEYEGYFQGMLALDFQKLRSRREMEEALEPAVPNLIVRRFLLKNLAHDPDDSYRWKINLRGIHKNYPHICEAITSTKPFDKPALFLYGGKSNYVSDKDKPVIRALFPQAQFELIPQAGHWMHADAPEEFVGRVGSFLSADDAD
ncbi:MAG TPA: alpha/beta fold hydrolase [Verrucomicrobiae bacterium]|jgi:pimeloyl-ACP methyl ester carboxylesterase